MVILTPQNCFLTQEPGFFFQQLQPPFSCSGNPSDMPLSERKLFQHQEEEINIDECAARSSAPSRLPEHDCFLPKIAAFWWEFSASAARPNRMSNFSKLCPLPIWLLFFSPHSLLAGALVQQRLFCCINIRCALLLLMLQCKDKPELEIPPRETQTRLLLRRGVNDFLRTSKRKAKPTKHLYVSRKARKQSTAQRAALNGCDSHWK